MAFSVRPPAAVATPSSAAICRRLRCGEAELRVTKLSVENFSPGSPEVRQAHARAAVLLLQLLALLGGQVGERTALAATALGR